MPHDIDNMVHWHEPKPGEKAGYGRFDLPKSDYDQFMESDGIPIVRGVEKPDRIVSPIFKLFGCKIYRFSPSL